MIGKRKGITLGKLRIITLIEANLQHVMRMFLDDEKEEITESDGRFSTGNYRSRNREKINT